MAPWRAGARVDAGRMPALRACCFLWFRFCVSQIVYGPGKILLDACAVVQEQWGFRLALQLLRP